MRDPVYLTMVTDQNNNKYYNMEDNGNGTFTVKYGRIGGNETTKVYSDSDWEKVYRSKVKKGYTDVSHLHKKSGTQEYKPLDDKEIQGLIDDLMAKSRQFTGQYYDANLTFTPKMLDEAQLIIDELAKSVDKKYSSDRDALDDFNRLLLKLWKVLPRKMKKVQDELCYRLDRRISFLNKEQSLLDNLKVQQVAQQPKDSSKTILEELGVSMSKCTDEELEFIKKHLADISSRYKLKRAWVCRLNSRDEGFEEYLKNNGLKNNKTNVKFYWHGTRTENVFSILSSGLQLNPVNAHTTGKMFGYGIYSAPKAQKSIGYTSLSGSYWARGGEQIGYMFLNAVITGNPYHTKDNGYHHGISISSLTGDKFSSNFANYHSVYAHAGQQLRNDEIIVYNQNQIASRYLVELEVR